MKKKYVIIGNGAAGISAAKKIRSLDRESSITIFTNERFPFYYKPRLPEVLAGEITLDRLPFTNLPGMNLIIYR